MVQYSQSDYLNELSRILRGRYQPGRVSGVVDAQSQHTQILELARTVFLLRPQAVYYLARLVKNALRAVVSREVSYVEDMLVALTFLERPPNASPIGNQGPSQLRDAAAALARLESAGGSVRDRAELVRFNRIVEQFTGTIRPSLTTQGQFRLTMSEARDILRQNMVALRSAHSAVLRLTLNLRTILSVYDLLDLPSQFSTTALINIRRELLQLASLIEESADNANDRNGRAYLLRVLSSRVITELIANFDVQELRTPVLTSGNTGLAANGSVGRAGGEGPYTAQASGEGTAAEAITGPGPWLLDSLNTHLLTFAIDGGTPITFDLSVIEGPGLHGDNPAPFADADLSPVWPGPGGAGSPPPPPPEDFEAANRLHVVVDSNTYDLTSQEWGRLGQDNVWRPGALRDEPPPSGLLTSPRIERRAHLDLGGGVLGNPLQRVEYRYELYNEYYDSVRAQPPRKLGFKHLGTPVFFSLGQPSSSASSAFQPGSGFGGWEIQHDTTLENPSEWENVSDRRWPYIFVPRTIIELAPLASMAMALVPGETDVFEASSIVEPGTTTQLASAFSPDSVGFYIRVQNVSGAYERYEIVEYVSPVRVRLAMRGDLFPGPALVTMFGSRGDYTQFTFSPDLLADTDDVACQDEASRGPWNVADTCEIVIGAAVKTTLLPLGLGGDIATAVAALSSPTNGDHATNKYAHASYFVTFREQAGFTGRVTIQSRSRFLVNELSLSPTFYLTRPDLQVPQTGPVVVSQTVGDIGPSLDTLTAPSGTFTGVNVGDRLVVLSGNNQGSYRILTVPSDTTITVARDFVIAETAIQFEVTLYSGLSEHPGPYPAVTIGFSGHEVFGFAANETTDPSVDPYLTVEELEAVIRETMDTSTTELEVLETDVFGGTISINGNSPTMVDGFANFIEAGVQANDLLEVQEGPYAGVYIILNIISQFAVTVQMNPGQPARGFPARQEDVPYRIFRRRLRIASLNTGPGSSVEVTAAPSVLQLPSGVQAGTSPSIEAVNDAGENMDLSGLNEGDNDGDLVIGQVSDDGRTATVVGGVPTTLTGRVFSFTSATQQLLEAMTETLTALSISRTRLAKHNFDQDLNRLDAALSPVVAPGQAFAANVNTARTRLRDLLQVLTDAPTREAEHGVSVDGGANIEAALAPYAAPREPALDTLLDTLNEFGFDRALRLLVTGDLASFFGTDAETASYAGALNAAARAVYSDLPARSQTLSAVQDQEGGLAQVEFTTDGDSVFEDVEDEGSELV